MFIFTDVQFLILPSLTKRARRIQEGCGSRKQLWWYGAPIQSGNPAAAAAGGGRATDRQRPPGVVYTVLGSRLLRQLRLPVQTQCCHRLAAAAVPQHTATLPPPIDFSDPPRLGYIAYLVGAGLCWGKCCRRRRRHRGMCADKPMCTARRASCCGEQKESQEMAALLAIAAA